MRAAVLGLLVAPFQPTLFSADSCVSRSFFGIYNHGDSTTRSIYLGDLDCFNFTAQGFDVALDNNKDVSLVTLERNPRNILVWLHEAAVSEELKSLHQPFSRALDTFVNQLSPKALSEESGQFPLGNPWEVTLLYRSDSAALISVNQETAQRIDTLIPAFWKSSLLPVLPVSYYPVPGDAVKRIKDILSFLKFNPDIAAIVNSISIPQMRNDIRFLTGEDGKSGIVSRHSFAEGSRVAAAWLKDRFEDTGAKCKIKPFASGFAPNVVCRYTSIVKTNATIVLGAHYDSRGSFGSTRAPGGDDDGSGTISLLSIARTIARRGIKFHTNVELVAFAGEEQGLVGSRAYARELRSAGANVTLMIQADMLAYHASDEPAQLGLPDLIGTPEVAQLVSKVSSIYSPELRVGFTPACCSDHQSFHEQGYPATQVFERAGPIADPMYHNSGDLSDREGYDFDQVKSIAKVQFATLLHAAGFTVVP